jgi:hypothetical protein
VEITQINDLKCLNGGTLSNENVCLCSFGYSGVDCGNRKLYIFKKHNNLSFIPYIVFLKQVS